MCRWYPVRLEDWMGRSPCVRSRARKRRLSIFWRSGHTDRFEKFSQDLTEANPAYYLMVWYARAERTGKKVALLFTKILRLKIRFILDFRLKRQWEGTTKLEWLHSSLSTTCFHYQHAAGRHCRHQTTHPLSIFGILLNILMTYSHLATITTPAQVRYSLNSYLKSTTYI